MKENQGNEQNPPDNCTQEVITSVWSRIFNFGKKNLSNWMPGTPFAAKKRPGGEFAQKWLAGRAKTSENDT